jgi:hypothetical protein
LTQQGIPAQAVTGETSQYDVVADGRLVFSKQQAGRWPEDGEILRLLR